MNCSTIQIRDVVVTTTRVITQLRPPSPPVGVASVGKNFHSLKSPLGMSITSPIFAVICATRIYGLFMASYRSLIAHSLHNLRLECATKHTECSLAGLGMNYCSHKEPSITFRDKPSVSCELRFTERHVTWVGWYAWYIVMKRHLLALPDHNDFFLPDVQGETWKKIIIYINLHRYNEDYLIGVMFPNAVN